VVRVVVMFKFYSYIFNKSPPRTVYISLNKGKEKVITSFCIRKKWEFLYTRSKKIKKSPVF